MKNTRFWQSWKSNSWEIRLLRLFLGSTWLYAGLQKATDVGFLHAGSTSYIGKQLAAFATTSPLRFLLQHAIRFAQPIGWFVMLSEIAIGLAVLAGVLSSLAAISGAVMSLGLWLSASWSVSPYFLGSDSAYFVMWTILFLAFWKAKERTRMSAVATLKDRRTFIGVVAVAIASLGTALVGTKFQKQLQVKATGQEIVKLANFPVGSSMQYTTSNGQPAILFRTALGVFAYSAICSHQGCIVSYNNANKKIECPCHGGQYDPFNGAQVVAGPPPFPLDTCKVHISNDAIVAG